MFTSIFDHRKQEILIFELVGNNEFNDEGVINKIGHTDYSYMNTKNLVIKIDELNKDTIEIITKFAKAKNDFELLKAYLKMDIEAGNFDIDQHQVAQDEYKRILNLD